MATSLSWICPKCGNTDIEEVQTVKRVVPIEEITEKYGVQLAINRGYDVSTTVECYRCTNCYFRLHSEKLVKSAVELVDTLK